jgi:hypothetical protein
MKANKRYFDLFAFNHQNAISSAVVETGCTVAVLAAF